MVKDHMQQQSNGGLLTRVGSEKSYGKSFAVNDTMMQAEQRTAIAVTTRYGR